MLSDTVAERAVLASIIRYGAAAYYDVADIINSNTFTIDSNVVIYDCLQHILKNNEQQDLDLAIILSAGKELGLETFLSRPQELSHLSAIMKFPTSIKNTRKFAAKIRKLQIARLMYDQLEATKDKYLQIKGDESISHILGLAEESIFNFTELLNDNDEEPQKIFHDIEEYLLDKAEHPVDQIGISTGFPKYDFAIGGGLRKGTVNIVGARAKVGKTLFALNAGVNIANKNIPVLHLDTEMRREDQQARGAAMLSVDSEGKSTINDIETGQFAQTDYRKQKLIEQCKRSKDTPFFHKNIGGKPFEDQLSIIRRWIARVVGLNDQGTAKDCVVIYDYLKLMDAADMKAKNLAEFQMLGFMMTSLHNFALRYDIPILAFIQLNRDGITKESTDTASGSDRIIWLCSNFTIYKKKSDEEIAKDGEEHGNRKLVPVISRHGEGLEQNDYINIIMRGKYAALSEGKTALELEDGGDYTNDPDDSRDVPF